METCGASTRRRDVDKPISKRRRQEDQDKPISKRRRQEEQGPTWSDLPFDVLEHIFRRLRYVDRIRMKLVCKGWSLPNSDIIAAAVPELPWAMKFSMNPSYYNVGCQMLDPLSQDIITLESVRQVDAMRFIEAKPCASKHGWVLFKELDFYHQKIRSLFLYSPFTTEEIKLPDLGECPTFPVATFSLDATSPKCVIFLIWARRYKIYVKLCRAGDKSWKTFEFDGFDEGYSAVDATYVNGVLYCVFKRGHLGAFNVELEEWTMFDISSTLCGLSMLPFCFHGVKLIASGTDLLLLSPETSLQLLKLDFSKMAWVYENNLNNQVLFVGYTSFSSPATGETSQLANTIFSSFCLFHPSVRFYGSTSPSRSRLYDNCVKAIEDKMYWIEPPLGVTWRAHDLIRAV